MHNPTPIELTSRPSAPTQAHRIRTGQACAALLAWTLALASAGCGQPEGGAPSFEASSSSVVSAVTATGQGPADDASSHFYLRCNATGWDVDDATRLVPVPGRPGVLELSFAVREPYMVNRHDDCVVTETHARNGWGDVQRFYDVEEGAQTAPFTAHLRVQRLAPGNGGVRNFAVKYRSRGAHRAELRLADLSLSIAEAAPRGAGSVAWTSTGTLSVDAAGRIYRTSLDATRTLARLDVATGAARWTRPLGEAGYFDAACVDGGEAMLVEGPQLVRVSVATGALVWSSDLDGALRGEDVYPTLRCRRGNPLLLVQWSDAAGAAHHIAAVHSASGAVAWTFDADGYPGVAAWTHDLVLLTRFDLPGGHLEALDPESGASLWSRDDAASLSAVCNEADGALYLATSDRLRRVDRRTGALLWSFSDASGFPWPTFEGGLLVTRSGNRLDSRDPATGRVRWSLEGAGSWAPSLVALPDGSLIAYGTDDAQGATRLERVRADGAWVWSVEHSDPGAYPIVDKRGRLYLRGATSLSLLDRATGAARWRHEGPPSPRPEPWFQPERVAQVVDSSPDTVWITAYAAGPFRFPPMALMALDAASGLVRWRVDEPEQIHVVATDDVRLIAITSYFSGAAKAYLK